MIKLLKNCPLTAFGSCGKQFDFELEPTTVLRPISKTKYGINVEVWAGKYEGIKGVVPLEYCTHDTMQLR